MESSYRKDDELIEEKAYNFYRRFDKSLKDDSENEESIDEDENQLTLPMEFYIQNLKYYRWEVIVLAYCITPECERFLDRKLRVNGLRWFYLESKHPKLRCRCCGQTYRIKFYTVNVDVSIRYRTSHGMKCEKHNFRRQNSFEFRLPDDWVSCEAKFTRILMSEKLQRAVERVMTGI